MRDIIERMITTRCGLALAVETRNAENIGDKATVKKRNGTGIDESNVVISIYFYFSRKIYMLYYERKIEDVKDEEQKGLLRTERANLPVRGGSEYKLIFGIHVDVGR